MNKVSVIIPIYNAEKYLPVTMQCLMEQNYEDYEIVAVDDCSTDSSGSILKEYQKRFSDLGTDFVIANRDRNGGLSAAINTGIKNASGDYLCFPDADDELEPDYLSSMMSVLLSDREARWVRCDYTIVLDDENREYEVLLPTVSVYKDDFYDFISKYVAHNAWNMIVERGYFDRCIGDEILDSRLTQEWSILLPLSYYSDYARCRKKLYRYHIRKSAMSSWQDKDLEPVIDHINGLEELNIAVLNTIENGDSDRISKAKTAIEIYYHLFRCKKYREHRLPEAADAELDQILRLGNEYVEKGLYAKLDNPDIYNRLVFDALLSGKVDTATEEYRKFRQITEKRFGIVYDKGGAELIKAITAIYGEPEYMIPYEDCEEKLLPEIPVIGLIQNSQKYGVLADKAGSKGIACIEYREVRDSIRGWGYLNRERF